MDTNTTDSASSQPTLFNPLSGWEAASRWNAATFDMMARAWQQWLTLMTVVPPHVLPARTARESARPASPTLREAHAFAKDESGPARASSKREARPAARREAKRAATGKSKTGRVRG